MIINQIYSIDSCDDVELNIKRGSKLEFRLTYDDSKEIEAIVCIIPGGAEDMNNYIYVDVMSMITWLEIIMLLLLILTIIA